MWAAPKRPAARATPAAPPDRTVRARRPARSPPAAASAAELRDRGVDMVTLRSTAAGTRFVERHAVAAHGGLGLGGADDVVQEFWLRLARAARSVRAGSGIPRRWRRVRSVAADARGFVHDVLPGEPDFQARPILSSRLSRPALPRHPENCYGWYQRKHAGPWAKTAWLLMAEIGCSLAASCFASRASTILRPGCDKTTDGQISQIAV